MTTRQVELFMPASQDDSFIEQNMNMVFTNFLGEEATAGRFGIGDGEPMKRVTITISAELGIYTKPAEPDQSGHDQA